MFTPTSGMNEPSPMAFCVFKNIYLFIWLPRVLVAAGGLLSCGMRTLTCGMHVGSSSLTRDRTPTRCIGSMTSYPLRHQGSPQPHFSYTNKCCRIQSRHDPSNVKGGSSLKLHVIGSGGFRIIQTA